MYHEGIVFHAGSPDAWTTRRARDILNECVGLDPKTETRKYYERRETLLRLIEERAQRLAAEMRCVA